MDVDRVHSRRATPGRVPRTRPHLAMLANALGFAAVVAFVVTLLIRHNELPAETNWRIAGWGLLVALGGFVAPVARWRSSWVELDESQLRWTMGIVRPRTFVGDVGRWRSLSVEQGLLGRWLGYGTLRVVDERGIEHTFGPVGAADAFREASSQTAGRRRPRGDR